MNAAPRNKNEMPIFDAPGRYAYALFELALEENQLSERVQELRDLSSMIAASGELAAFLENQSLSRAVKTTAMKKLAAQAEFSPSLTSFLLLVMDRGRSASLAAIAHAFIKISDIHNLVVPIGITSAAPLTSAQQEKLTQLCATHFGADAKISFLVDDSLLGGVKLNLPGRVLDASLAEKFSQLEQQFNHNPLNH